MSDAAKIRIQLGRLLAGMGPVQLMKRSSLEVVVQQGIGLAHVFEGVRLVLLTYLGQWQRGCHTIPHHVVNPAEYL